MCSSDLHVFGSVSKKDLQDIETCIDLALAALPLAVNGHWQDAMLRLHNEEQPFIQGEKD